jgi:hypothetical protein
MLPGRARTKKINQFRKHESLKTRKRDKINFVLSKLRTFVLEKKIFIKCKDIKIKILESIETT